MDKDFAAKLIQYGNFKLQSISCYTQPSGWFPLCPRSDEAVRIAESVIRTYHWNKEYKVVSYLLRSISAQVNFLCCDL